MDENASTNQQHVLGGSQMLLNIRYHENSSWQGSIQRLDTGETISFRSILEMLFLIETALGQTQIPNENRKDRFRSWKKEKEVDGRRDQKGAAGA